MSGRPRLALQGWGTPRRGLPKGLRDPRSEADLTGDLPAGDGGTRGRTGRTRACTCVSVSRWGSSRGGRVESPVKGPWGQQQGGSGGRQGKPGPAESARSSQSGASRRGRRWDGPPGPLCWRLTRPLLWSSCLATWTTLGHQGSWCAACSPWARAGFQPQSVPSAKGPCTVYSMHNCTRAAGSNVAWPAAHEADQQLDVHGGGRELTAQRTPRRLSRLGTREPCPAARVMGKPRGRFQGPAY